MTNSPEDVKKEDTKITSDEACQTHLSLENQLATTDQNPSQLSSNDFSVISCGSSCASSRTDADTTVPKQVGASEVLDDCTGKPVVDDRGENAVGEQETEGEHDRPWISDQQCAHWENIGDIEHPPKQPETREARAPIQSTEDNTEEVFLRSGSLDRDDTFSAFSGSTSSWSAVKLCDACKAADTLILCESSKTFWHVTRGESCCERVWNSFHALLKEQFPAEEAIKQSRVMNLLKSLLGVTGELQKVHIEKYVDVVTAFGPFRLQGQRCIVLQQLENLVKESSSQNPRKKSEKNCWFAGPISGEEAETLLANKCPGTFLIRMSESERKSGSFVLELVMPDESIQHFLIQGNPAEAARSNPFSQCLTFRNRTFQSLTNVVNEYLRVTDIGAEDDPENAVRAAIICPGLPYNKIVNGYKR